MNEKQKTKLKILGKVFQYTVNFFHEQGFTQLMPVMLGKSVDPLGPDPNSSVVGIPTIDYQDEKLSLVTSMILHKQVALQEGLEKIFVMSPNVRLEKQERIETGRHLFEFTQADFEIANANMEDVFGLVEQYYDELTPYLETRAGKEFENLKLEVFDFQPPFAKYSTTELEEKYGVDWELYASLDNEQPFWALSHKREFYDAEDKNNPGTYFNYDIVYPFGYGEGLSGAEREHEFERILMRIERDGLPKENYSSYLEKAKEGFVPSAGAGIGLERLARFLTKSEHVGDVTLFRRVPGEKVEI